MSTQTKTSTSSNNTSRWFYRITYLFACILFAFTLRNISWHHVHTCLAATGPALLWIFLPYAIAIGCDAWSWGRLLAALGYARSWSSLFAIRLSSEAILLSTPGGSVWAEGFKTYAAYKKLLIPLSATTATLVAKKAFIILTQGVYLAIAGFFVFKSMRHRDVSFSFQSQILGLITVACVFLWIVGGSIFVALKQGSLSQSLHRWLCRIPIRPVQRWLAAREQGFHETDRYTQVMLRHPSTSIKSSLALLLAWFCESIETFLIVRMFGVSISWSEATAIEAMSSVVRAAAFMVPAGLGFQDMSYLALFHTFNIPGAASVGSSFILLKRTKELVWIAFGYLLMLLSGIKKTKDVNPYEPSM